MKQCIIRPKCCRTVLKNMLSENGTMSGQRHFPDMARNRCRARGVSPTWHKNDVGAEVFPRHGVKPMSGQRRFPDMAQNRCRASSVSPTWHKTDVGAEVFPR